MAVIVCTEYDRESFLDEYSPLCNVNVTPKRTKMEQFRRRCFSEMPMTNNPLSKFRNNTRTKKLDRLETKFLTKRSASDSTLEENSERDSGYFSIDPEESIYFIAEDGERKWDDLEPFIDEGLGDHSVKAASFIKKRTKFLLYKHNMKLSNGKYKDKATTKQSVSPVTEHSNKNNQKKKDNCEDKVTPRSRKLSWKKAKKHASIVVRFIRRDSKGEDEVSLLRSASIRSNHPQIDRIVHDDVTQDHKDPQTERTVHDSVTQTYKDPQSDRINHEDITQDHKDSNNSLELGNIVLDDSFTSDEQHFNQEIISPFDDSFITKENIGVSPLDIKYLTPRNISRERPLRHRPRSLSYHATTNYTQETGDENNNVDFVAKYLNRSHSLDFSDIRELENDNHFEQSLFPDDDFEPESTVFCVSPDIFHKENIVTEKEEIKNNINKKGRLSHGEFETIIEEEVDNYILSDHQDNNDDCLDNVKHIGSLSYSVNNLYDLLNRENLFNFDCSLDGLLV